MKRLILIVIAFCGFIPAGCKTVDVDGRYLADDMYSDRLAFVYDYGEAVPAEAGIYQSGQAALDGIVGFSEAWTGGVESTMQYVDIKKAGHELEVALRSLYQQDLYKD